MICIPLISVNPYSCQPLVSCGHFCFCSLPHVLLHVFSIATGLLGLLRLKHFFGMVAFVCVLRFLWFERQAAGSLIFIWEGLLGAAGERISLKLFLACLTCARKASVMEHQETTEHDKHTCCTFLWDCCRLQCSVPACACIPIMCCSCLTGFVPMALFTVVIMFLV